MIFIIVGIILLAVSIPAAGFISTMWKDRYTLLLSFKGLLVSLKGKKKEKKPKKKPVEINGKVRVEHALVINGINASTGEYVLNANEAARHSEEMELLNHAIAVEKKRAKDARKLTDYMPRAVANHNAFISDTMKHSISLSGGPEDGTTVRVPMGDRLIHFMRDGNLKTGSLTTCSPCSLIQRL